MMPKGPHMRLFEQAAFGRLAQIHLLDDRQYRSPQPCAAPGRGGATTVEDCQERLDTRITMLCDIHERWLLAGLDRSTAPLNLIAHQTLIVPLDQETRAVP